MAFESAGKKTVMGTVLTRPGTRRRKTLGKLRGRRRLANR